MPARAPSFAACAATLGTAILAAPWYGGQGCVNFLFHCQTARPHCEPTGPREARPDDRLREAIQLFFATTVWVASSLTLLATT